jgi:hypothetical protein
VPRSDFQPPFYYQFTFLEPANHTVAFTCQAAQDDPDQADATVMFPSVNTGITVAAHQTTIVDIP